MTTEKLEEVGTGQALFPEREKQGSAHAPSEFARDGEPWLAAMQDCIASQVFPAASSGATHASRGWPWMVTLGLRGAGTAQRNGFTAVRKMPAPSRLRAREY